MSEVKRIKAPFDKEVVKSLKAGDNVLISGTIIAARDAAHKALTETLARGEKLPVELNGETIYYVGPTPAKPNQAIGAAGPTTSGRMDKYTPTMINEVGIIGGIGALISQSIKKYEVLAYPELGPEAVARLTVEDFPAIVAIDCEGNNFYEVGQAPYKKI